jgi:hypothetical protein
MIHAARFPVFPMTELDGDAMRLFKRKAGGNRVCFMSGGEKLFVK